ncbi:MAG: hypothetical protein JSR54_19860, partial [Proteobacteria bacterium]|nr:hypothetical protein [Pseudomonadota bacterium]
MTVFILAGALMVSIALAIVAWPLWKNRAAEGRATLVSLAVLALALPAGVALIYPTVSNWDWSPGAAQGPPGQHALDASVVKLEERLRQNPGDVDGWLLLGRSYVVTQKFDRASGAFAKAYELSGGKNVEAVIGYGETLAVLDQSTLKGKAGQLFEEALKLDPANPKALFYGGAAAAATGQLPVARERWAALIHQELPPEIRTLLAQRIADVDRQLGRKPDPEIEQLASAASPPRGGPAGAEAAAQPAAAPAAAGPGRVT